MREFSKEVKDFRIDFREKAPFNINLKATSDEVVAAYHTIGEYSTKIDEIKKKAIKFKDLENLFELEKTKYKELNDCQSDIKKLSRLWNHNE